MLLLDGYMKKACFDLRWFAHVKRQPIRKGDLITHNSVVVLVIIPSTTSVDSTMQDKYMFLYLLVQEKKIKEKKNWSTISICRFVSKTSMY